MDDEIVKTAMKNTSNQCRKSVIAKRTPVKNSNGFSLCVSQNSRNNNAQSQRCLVNTDQSRLHGHVGDNKHPFQAKPSEVYIN